MARTARKIATTLMAATLITGVTPAVVQAGQETGTVEAVQVVVQAGEAVAEVAVQAREAAQSVAVETRVVEEQAEVAEQTVAVEAQAEVDAQEVAVETQVVEAQVEAAGPLVVSADCVGGQASVDTCVGATYYAPVADYLGVPYYAQHNGMGGEAWLSLGVGDTVIVEGVAYQVAMVRTVGTGGDIDQIAGMGGQVYLQTCLDDAVHSNVYALVQA